MNPEDFYTRSGANEGCKMPLKDPSGKPTEEWLMVRGVESDAYIEKRNDIWRKMAEEQSVKDDKGKEDTNSYKKYTVPLLACLVTGWSFKTKFTEKGATDLLINAPYIRDQLDIFSAKKENFLKKK